MNAQGSQQMSGDRYAALARPSGAFAMVALDQRVSLETMFEEAVHSLKDAPRVVDIRNCGLAAGIDIEPDANAPGLRGYDAMRRAYFDESMVIRVSGDTIALAPALIATESDIARMVEGVRSVLSRLS